MATAFQHTATLNVDGCRLAYSRDGAGSPVVLIQGVGVHGHGWRPQLDALLPRHTCLWFDNRGVGASQPASRRVSVRQLADDVVALLEAQEWSAAHIVGHSLGGLIAQRVALSHPSRVRSLALLCTFARGRDAGANARMAWIGLRSRVGPRAMRRSAFLEILPAPGSIPASDRQRVAENLAPLFGHDLADHSPVEMQQLSAMRAEDTTKELPQLAGIPTLVVSGAHDPIAPPTLGRQIAAGIPGARYEELADQSHGAPIMDAATINALLLAHLADADQPR